MRASLVNLILVLGLSGRLGLAVPLQDTIPSVLKGSSGHSSAAAASASNQPTSHDPVYPSASRPPFSWSAFSNTASKTAGLTTTHKEAIGAGTIAGVGVGLAGLLYIAKNPSAMFRDRAGRHADFKHGENEWAVRDFFSRTISDFSIWVEEQAKLGIEVFQDSELTARGAEAINAAQLAGILGQAA